MVSHFFLYVSEKQGFANAVLTQRLGSSKQPVAYFSTLLDNIVKGMPLCYRWLAVAAFAYQKASTITMGHPTTLYTTHSLHTLLTRPTFVITQAWKTGYYVILSSLELTIQRCDNPIGR